MKIHKINLCMLALLGGLLNAGVRASEVNISGVVIAAPCIVDTSSVSQTVDFGQLRRADLKAVGAASEWQPFQVKLIKCPVTTTYATATFSGTPFTDDPTLYRNAGSAEGVAVQVVQAADKTKVQGNGSSMTVTIDAQRNAIYALAGRVIRPAADTVVPGTVSSVVQMSFTYQ